MLLTDRNKIIITGYHMSSSLVLSNPNQSLAVSFQIEIQSLPQSLQQRNGYLFKIEPIRGMILKGQSQLIKISHNNNRQLKTIALQKAKVKIITSFFSQYNKQLMKLNNIYNKELLTKTQEIFIPLELDNTKLYQQNRQVIGANSKKSQLLTKNNIGQNYINTMISSNFIKKMKQKQDENIRNHVNHKLRQDLQFVKNQQNGFHQQKLSKGYIPTQLEISQIKLKKDDQDYLNQEGQFSIISKTKTRRQIFQGSGISNRFQFKKNMQFIILAIIAAFFVSLGSNIGTIFKQ